MRSLDRLMALIEAVAMSPVPLSPSEVSERIGLAFSSTARLMRQAADAGVLQRLDESNTYTLGVRLYAITGLAAASGGAVAAAHAECERLRDGTGETVSLHLRSGGQRICFAQVESTQDVRRVVKVGLTVPLHTGAVGRVLLADLPPAEADDYLSTLDLPAETEAELRAELPRIRDQGWAMAVDAWIKDVAALVAPIRDKDGRTYAVLAVSGPSFRWTPGEMARHVEPLTAAADRISSLYAGGRFLPSAAQVIPDRAGGE